jgi:hypothetical protein
MSLKEAAKKKYCKIKPMFKAYFPNGTTIAKACRKYKELYPKDDRDCAGIICSQKNHGNFKIIGCDSNGVSVYQLYVPTKREKITIKLEAIEKQLASAERSRIKQLAKLEKYDKKNSNVFDNTSWDLDQANQVETV